MMGFRDLTLEDRDRIWELTDRRPLMQCDNSFEQLYLWRHDLNIQICYIKDFAEDRIKASGEDCDIDFVLIKCFYEGECYFKFPLGDGDFRVPVMWMKRYCEERNIPFLLRNISELDADILMELFPGEFEYHSEDENSDYVYLAEKLATYPGHHLCGRRTLCNKFERNFNWEYHRLTEEYTEPCRRFLDMWMEQNRAREAQDINNEYAKINEAFDKYESLGFDGGLITVDGNVVAFSIGRMITSDIFDAFYEKGNMDYDGAYPMICRELVRMLMEQYPDLVYINREEDMGQPNIRKAKKLLCPEFMINKYTAVHTR